MGNRLEEDGVRSRGLAGGRRRSVQSNEMRHGGLDPTAMQHLVGFLLAMVTIRTDDVFDQHIAKPFALREVDFTILVLLHSNRGAAPKQLAQALNLPAPKVTLLLDRLMERGLLERRRSPTDGRALQLHLTPKGTQLTQRALEVSTRMEDGLLQALSPAERAMLRELLIKLAHAAQLALPAGRGAVRRGDQARRE
jgi:DNA-binding MarR family transcriptional regulator